MIKEQKQKSNVKEGIEQILKRKYYQVFENTCNMCQNFYIIGVAFNALNQRIIQEILVKKFIGENMEFDKEENWKVIYI